MSADRLNATKQGKLQTALDRLYGAGNIVVVMAWAGSRHRTDFLYSTHKQPNWHGHATINRAMNSVTQQPGCDRHEPCAALLTELCRDPGC